MPTNNALTSGAEEPLITVAIVTSVVTAILAAAVAFGLPITDDQQAATLGLVAVLAPFVVGLVARGRVYSPATVERLLTAKPRPDA